MIVICGIAGLNLSLDEDIDAHALSSALLLEIESRGRDATGAAWFDGNGVLWTQKDHMRATDWVPFSDVPSEARTVILHTRYATQGSHWDNRNNHPIVVKDDNGDRGVVGVHNGMIWNDDRLYTRMGVEDRRVAEVDSEAIFAAIAYGCEKVDGKPRLAKTLEGVLEEIGGSAAIGWLDLGGDPHTLHVARISNSPLHFGFTKKGSFVFASEQTALRAAARKCNMQLEDITSAPEGSYMRVRAGSIVDRRSYEPWESQRFVSYATGMGGFAGRVTPASTSTEVALLDVPSLDERGDNDEYSRVEGNLHKNYKYVNGQWLLASVTRLTNQQMAAIEGDNVVDLGEMAARREALQQANAENVTTEILASLDATNRGAVIDAEVVDDDEDDDDPFASGSDRDRPKQPFQPYFSGGALYAHVVHLLFNDVDYLDGSEAAVEYSDREVAIEQIARDMTDNGIAHIGAELDEAGAYLRQGDLVVTDLGHLHNLAGTIVGLPPEFPEGEYLIKLMVPNARYRGDFEPIIVSRRLEEFVLDNPIRDDLEGLLI